MTLLVFGKKLSDINRLSEFYIFILKVMSKFGLANGRDTATDVVTDGDTNSIKSHFFLPHTVKDTLIDDINYCKERILESQKKLENIQSLLKLTRYASVKNFYENKKTLLDTSENKTLQNTILHQHPAVIAAQEQLLKLQKRPKRQAAKKIHISSIQDKLDRNREKGKHESQARKQLSGTESFIDNDNKNKKSLCVDELSGRNPVGVKNTNDCIIPVLNANRTSRFYSRYTLLIGNTSQFVGEDNHDNCTHKWCVYVRRPEDEPSISEIIRKVRFHLDASYKPNDIIEVIAEPFSLCKRGWGEFPVTVEMFFKSNDKPVSFIHNLKLDKLKTGRYCLDTETAVEVVLDINPKNSEVQSNIESRKLCNDQAVLTNMRKFERNVEVTNIKNIIKHRNSFDSDSNSSTQEIEELHVKQENLDLKIDKSALNPDTNIHYLLQVYCVSISDNHEYVIRIPEAQIAENQKYTKTREKSNYLNEIENKVTSENKLYDVTIPTFVNKVDTYTKIIDPQQFAFKRKCSEPIISTPNKLKITDFLYNHVTKPATYKLEQDLISNPLNSLKEKIKTPDKKSVSVLHRSLIKNITTSVSRKPLVQSSLKQSSLLKCNNMIISNNHLSVKSKCTKVPIKQLNNNSNSLLFNISILSNNIKKNIKESPKTVDDNPKIIIVRQGNSVVTKQNSFTSRTRRITLSPERKLLGPKRNTDDKKMLDNNMMNSILNNRIYSTLDKDLEHLKQSVEQLSVQQVIEYALKRVALYSKPGMKEDIYFDVPTLQDYANYSLIKQIYLEIKRSKCISNFIKNFYSPVPVLWDYVSILKFAREHGYLPKEHKYWLNVSNDVCNTPNIPDCSNFVSYTNMESLLSYFDNLLVSIPRDVHDTIEDIDVESVETAPTKQIKKQYFAKNPVLPVLYGDKLASRYIINTAKCLGITFQAEQLIPDVDHPSALELLCSIVQSFVSDLVRKSHGVCRSQGENVVQPKHIFSTLLSRPEFDMLSNKNLGLQDVDH